MHILLVAFILVIAFGAAVFFQYQSRIRGRWGFGQMVGVKCPRCQTTMPAVRKPASLQQGLWGGWTCPNCGAKIDKYGRELGG